MEHEFGEDWFSWQIPAFQEVTSKLNSRDSILEVGSFEGRSACWLLENVLSDTGTLSCIDNWYGVPEHVGGDGALAEKRFDKNVLVSKKPEQTVVKLTGNSVDELSKLIAAKKQFDFIYVDGNHYAPLVLSDIVMCYWLLAPGGIMHMDDYEWGINISEPTKHPKIAINGFLDCFKDRVELVHKGYQISVRRIS